MARQETNSSEPPDEPPTDEFESESFGELWKAVFNTFYDAFYNEVVADRVINSWQIVDDTSKILVAVTAS